jgi:glycosyltransferase involved in cell wall biosynthesis
LAALVAPWHVHRFIDVLWVTGERQRQLAHALGFRGERCWDGFYACDWKKFAEKAEILKSEKLKVESRNDEGFAGETEKHKTEIAKSESRGQKSEIRDQKSDLRPPTSDRLSFLFVGRYVEEKGIRDLAAAYRLYRTKVEKAWPLVCAGRGELASLLADAGAEDSGFVQPEDLPRLMHEASAFVLPSRFEPWGVVVQEAAAAGLPLIVSEACGASVHLVRDGYNGFITETGNYKHLASALIRMHRLNEVEHEEFGQRSFELSKQYTPERWARTLREGLAMLRPELS